MQSLIWVCLNPRRAGFLLPLNQPLGASQNKKDPLHSSRPVAPFPPSPRAYSADAAALSCPAAPPERLGVNQNMALKESTQTRDKVMCDAFTYPGSGFDPGWVAILTELWPWFLHRNPGNGCLSSLFKGVDMTLPMFNQLQKNKPLTVAHRPSRPVNLPKPPQGLPREARALAACPGTPAKPRMPRCPAAETTWPPGKMSKEDYGRVQRVMKAETHPRMNLPSSTVPSGWLARRHTKQQLKQLEACMSVLWGPRIPEDLLTSPPIGVVRKCCRSCSWRLLWHLRL